MYREIAKVLNTSLLPAIMASILWSLNPAVISRYGKGLKPVSFTGLRALIALIPLLPLLFSTGFDTGIPLHGWIMIILSAILGPGLGDALYTLSIKKIGGELAVIVSYTYIFFTQLFSYMLIREEIGLNTVAGAVIAFLGIAVATLNPRSYRGGRSSFTIGVLAGLSAGVLWGAATVLIKLSLSYIHNVMLLTLVRLIIITVVMLPLGVFLEGWYETSVLKDVVKASLVTGILGWTFGMYLFIYSINTIGATITSIATSLTPVLSQFTVRFISGSRLRGQNIAGALLVTTGIILTLA
ncbi:DMT family transporter [Thermogladius sp. 4427co]|uniref:DMT family transporter n=1 Tax=Thermogladius sp. 4427co TaxID=3450718 RepID=UPI003F78E758